MPLQYFRKHRHATWLELFFDLVFVATIGAVTHNLGHAHHGHIGWGQLGHFVVEFLPIWGIWAAHTLFANRYDTDSPGHRVASLVIMLLMVGIGAFVGEEVFGQPLLFLSLFVAIKLCLIGLFLHARHKLITGDPFPRLAPLALALGTLVSACALFFGDPVRSVLFVSGALLELPLLAWAMTRRGVPEVHREHLVERVGLLSIILLGESVISMTGALRGLDWDAMRIVAALAGFVAIGAIWWIYFDGFAVLDRAKCLTRGPLLMLPHASFSIGLLALANLIRHAITRELLPGDFQRLALLGLVLFYVGKQVPYFYAFPPVRINILINTAVCLGITFGAAQLTEPAWSLAGLALGLLVYVGLNLRFTLRKDFSPYVEAAEPVVETTPQCVGDPA